MSPEIWKICIILCLTVNCSIAIKINKEIYHVAAEPNKPISLKCGANETPEKCTFIRLVELEDI